MATIRMNYLYAGYKLILQAGLKRYVIMPFLINILLFIGLFFIAQHYFNELNMLIENHFPHWLQWLGKILWILFFISFSFVVIYTFSLFANLLSAPFNSLLAEKVEFYLSGKTIPSKSMLEICQDLPRSMGRQLSIIAYYLPRVMLILLLFFIPIIQIAAPIIWFLFNAKYLSLQYIDYPTENNNISLSEARVWLNQRSWHAFHFGISILLASMIPIVNFFVVPAAVAGATKFFLAEK